MTTTPVRSNDFRLLQTFEHNVQLLYALSEQTPWRNGKSLLSTRHRSINRQATRLIKTSALVGSPDPCLASIPLQAPELSLRPLQAPELSLRPLHARHSSASRRTSCRCQAAAQQTADGSSFGSNSAQQKDKLISMLVTWWQTLKPPKWLWRSSAACILGGQAIWRIVRGKAHFRNTIDQLKLVGPNSLGVAMLTSSFVGMVFTIQFVREFAKLGLTRSVGGVLGLALSRELTPVITCIILAGRVGSAFAAELGTMQVSEQVDSLRVLGSDPVNYLVAPRVLACMIAGPALNIFCFCIGLGASVALANTVYGIHPAVIINSAAHAITSWDIITSCIKAWVFGVIISVVSCSWGFTTTGGAKGVGESTTSAVVISLVLIFIADFCLSFLFFQGQGDALRQCTGGH